MNCSYCSTELPSGAMFCGECGRSVASTIASKAQSGKRTPLVVEAESLVEPEQFRDAIREPEPKSEPGPEATPASEPEPALAPETEPTPEPELAPTQVVHDDTCAQCGAQLDPSDIFCGECGFVRQVPGQRPRDTVSLDPFPWGIPGAVAAASPQTPTITPSSRAESAGYDDDTDDTRIVDRSPRGTRFVLQFSTGESVSVSGTGLLGRNPMPEPGEYVDAIVAISDPGKSVSKTHLEFGQDGSSFWVSDRYSGNGTVVREPEAQPRRCDPGKRYRIVRGSRVDIGEQFFIVS